MEVSIDYPQLTSLVANFIIIMIGSISPYLWFYPSLDALAIVAYQTGQLSNSYQVVSGYILFYYIDLFLP